MLVTSSSRRRVACVLALGLAAACCSSTSASRAPVQQGRDDTAPIIYLMPVLDQRALERTEHIGVTRQVEEAAKSILAVKGYRVEIAEFSSSDRVQMSEDARTIEFRAEEFVWAGPSAAERLLVIYLSEIDSELDTPTLDFRVKVSGMLIDAATRTALWQGAAEATSNMAGVFSLLSPGTVRYEAVYRSLAKLLSTLPANA